VRRPDGAWDTDVLAGLTAGQWADWISERVRGRDSRAPYGEDEYPYDPARLFTDLIREYPGPSRRDWAGFGEGAALFLGRLDPGTEQACVVQAALDVVGHLRVRTCAGAKKLVEWIEQGVFLPPRSQSTHLHEACIYALGAMQAPDKAPEMDLFRKWLVPLREGPADLRCRFAVSAFTGIAFGSRKVPEAELIALLKVESEASNAKVRMSLAPAILALFVDRDSLDVRRQLWQIVRGKDDGPKLWNRLAASLDHSRYRLPSWEDMKARSYSTVAHAASDLWLAPMRVDFDPCMKARSLVFFTQAAFRASSAPIHDPSDLWLAPMRVPA
jgi:hypothetical protein